MLTPCMNNDREPEVGPTIQRYHVCQTVTTIRSLPCLPNAAAVNASQMAYLIMQSQDMQAWVLPELKRLVAAVPTAHKLEINNSSSSSTTYACFSAAEPCEQPTMVRGYTQGEKVPVITTWTTQPCCVCTLI